MRRVLRTRSVRAVGPIVWLERAAVLIVWLERAAVLIVWLKTARFCGVSCSHDQYGPPY